MVSVDVLEDPALQYDPFAMVAKYGIPRQIDYDHDLPFTSMPVGAVPASIDALVALERSAPFLARGFLAHDQQYAFAARLDAAWTKLPVFKAYLNGLQAHDAEQYRLLEEYVLRGPGPIIAGDPVELALLRLGEAALRTDLFEKDFAGTLAQLQSSYASLPALSLYHDMQARERGAIKEVESPFGVQQVVPSYLFRGHVAAPSWLDELIDRAG